MFKVGDKVRVRVASSGVPCNAVGLSSRKEYTITGVYDNNGYSSMDLIDSNKIHHEGYGECWFYSAVNKRFNKQLGKILK